MKKYVFPFFISFGKNDSVDNSISIELSDEKAKRLVRSAKEGGRFRLDEDSNPQDIYDEVLFAILDAEKVALLADPTPVANALSWKKGYDPSKPITKRQITSYVNQLEVGINYPEELQHLRRTARKKVQQSTCESIVVAREDVKSVLQDETAQSKIIYVDGGTTLYYIPAKFAGKITVPGTVRSIEGRAFQYRDKLTEVEIEDGLLAIPDCAFEGCKALTSITVPGSVQTIGYNAFTKCENLSAVTLSEGLQKLDNTAFRFCSNLHALRFPASLKEVSAYITTYWNGLSKLTFAGMETEITSMSENSWRKVKLYVLHGSRAEACAKKYHLHYSILPEVTAKEVISSAGVPKDN